MMEISKTIEFEMGHRLPNHQGLCRNLHGHHYKVEVFVEGDCGNNVCGAPSEGMVVDFGELKRIMTEVIDKPLDHAFMFYCEDPVLLEMVDARILTAHGLKVKVVPFIPTAENIARMIFDGLAREVHPDAAWRISRVKVWETPSSCAVAERE